MDVYRMFYPQKAEYTFSPSAHGTFSRIGHILGYKSNKQKNTNIRIMPTNLSEHNITEINIECKKKWVKI